MLKQQMSTDCIMQSMYESKLQYEQMTQNRTAQRGGPSPADASFGFTYVGHIDREGAKKYSRELVMDSAFDFPSPVNTSILEDNGEFVVNMTYRMKTLDVYKAFLHELDAFNIPYSEKTAV